MLTAELLTALIAFAFVSSITPGPNNLMLMTSGTNFGFVRTIPHMLGVSVGFTVMIVLVGAGLAKIFELYPIAHLILKYASCAYLVWLAWKIATSPPPGAKSGAEAQAKPMTFIQAALFQWVNPKAWTMALTAVSAYTLPTDPVASLLIVAAVFGAINLPSVGSWTLLGMQLRRFLSDPLKLRIFNVTMAVILVATLYPVVFGPAAH
ncbi:MAG: LysE family translocator [Alphaproteobacteria bacterium]|jgi:threonine/homoserine/homoserine lactone efflux protein|nr:MAG: LysE family translocator [Alphaproteobacteria bacterium]